MAGCAQKPAPAPTVAIAPDPYGYLKASAVCSLSPVKTDPTGARTVEMKVRSDDGRCVVAVSQPDGTSYASFVLQTLPLHGKTLIHNYNNQTLVDYTPTTAYAGPDSFSVSLIPPGGAARSTLRVDAIVDATGVPLPVAPAAPAPTSTTSHKTTRHHVVHKKTH